MQAESANLTNGYPILADSNGLLSSVAAGTAAAARLALGLVDALDRMPTAMMPSRELSHYFHALYDEITIVAGTWTSYLDASQTDKDIAISVSGSHVYNSSHLNNDEIHFGSLTLNAGTYKIIICCIKSGDGGIAEILLGTTSLGTFDNYAASTTYNAVGVLTYSPTARVTGNLRLKVTGKNASSADYIIRVSRIEIIRTA